MSNGNYYLFLRTDANALLTSISEFEFIAILIITQNVFALTLSATQLLQAKSIDVMGCIELVTSLKSSVANFRNFIDLYHDYWYEMALLLLKTLMLKKVRLRLLEDRQRDQIIPMQSLSITRE